MILRSLIVSIIMTLSSPYARGDKMDIATHTIVINKLNGVLETLPENSAGRSDLELRLADLYSERSRLEAMDDVAKNCTQCNESKTDRQSAIQLYKKGIAKRGFHNPDKETKGRVVLQLAQLYELQGQTDEAKKVFEEVVKNSDQYSQELLGLSYAGLGEIYFNRIKYVDAQNNFEKALSITATPRKTHILYRVAWCRFHRDDYAKGTALLVQTLESPETADDNSFREEASRDLATFLSQGTVGAAEIQKLTDLSPANVRKDNLVYLAKELDRLGKKSMSVAVWNVVGQNEKSPIDQMESHLRMAELQFDAGKKDETLNELQATLDVWKTDGCASKGGEDECVVLRNRLKKLVIDWNRSEQDAPTALLLNAYAVFVSVFPDMEMNYRAALVARHLGQLDQAIQYYGNAAVLASQELKNGISNKDEAGIFEKDFEASLLGQIEIAEQTKDAQKRADAYSRYLTLNPHGQKAFEVKYQQAHLLYDAGRNLEAANSFRALALNTSGDTDLREKSADLSLDALVLAKSDENVVPWAQEYAKAFASRKADYLKIASHGTLSEVATAINTPGASNSQLRTSLNKLNQLNLSTATTAEKIAYFRNKLIIAEKLRDLPEVKSAANALLGLKKISAEDREFALSRLAWAAEMTLDFKTAFSLTSKLSQKQVTAQEKTLKLAMLSELSGGNSTPYFEKYIAMSPVTDQTVGIAAKLVRRAKNPRRVLAKYERLISQRPEVLAGLALEIFARDHDYGFAKSMLHDSAIQKTAAARVFSRFLYMKSFKTLEAEVANDHLNTRVLTRSLKNRLARLQNLESATARAAKTGDWFLQIVTLDFLSKQDRRLAAEIITIDSPKGLSRSQSLQYKEMLAVDAEKYRARGMELGGKVTELWNQEGMTSQLLEDYRNAKGEVRHLLAEELGQIAHVAPRGQRRVLIATLATGEAKPASINLKAAEQTVKENPFNVGDIEKLISLVENAGGETMVAYLDARLAQMQDDSVGVKR